MEKTFEFHELYSHETDAYNLKEFKPRIVDAEYLKNLGVSVEPSEATLQGLIRGSKIFMQRLENHTVIPVSKLYLEQCVPEEIQTEIHNHTGRCPTLTFEVNPIKGCNVGCQYCLVTDGVHEQKLVAYENYHEYVRYLLKVMNGTPTREITEDDIKQRAHLLKEFAEAIESAPEKKKEIEAKIVELSRGKNWNHYYYFSPKTEAFQEPTLQTGIAHRILREFIAHFREYPDSNARLFIASKAGTKHLLVKDEQGETILDLLEQLKDRCQFNTSVSIMPTEFRNLLEPYAAPIEERLNAVRMCQERGIPANSALVQPIFTPYLTDEHIKEFFDMLHDAGIINYKPEFLTACMENLAQLGQWLGYFDKSMEKALYEDYIMPQNADHRKQRGRTAPNRALSIGNIQRLMKYTDSRHEHQHLFLGAQDAEHKHRHDSYHQQERFPVLRLSVKAFQVQGIMETCWQVCHKLYDHRLDYFHRWYHLKPLVITSSRKEELHRMQQLLYKCIVYMADTWEEWIPTYMPLSEKVMEILRYQSRQPFRAGAYRPDYLVDEDGNLLLVEISSRFFGHGLWQSYPSEAWAESFMQNHPDCEWENSYEERFQYLKDLVPEEQKVVALRSTDRTSEPSFYLPFYEHFGHQTYDLKAEEVEPQINLWSKDAFVVSGLNQHDLLSYRMETLQAMVDARMMNDFRTIFIIHDKRFMRMLFEDAFTQRCLTAEETIFIRRHTIPTYCYEESFKGRWEDALTHKDDYILKPFDLGKSEGIYAGEMTDEETWHSLFKDNQLQYYILQPFIRQRTYPTVWEGTAYDDYICGMMLCIDDRYFDSGFVRTASVPVSNKVDLRVKPVIHSDSEKLKAYCHIL